MNILISLPYFPLENTGTGNSVYGLSKGLIAAGANVTVLAENDEYKELQYREVPYIEFVKSKSKNPFKVSSQLLDYINIHKNKIDLIVINGIFVPYVYTLAMFAKKVGIPYIHIPHGVYNDVAFTKSRLKKKIYFSLFEKKTIENALAVQMLSKTQFQDLQKIAHPKKVISVPNGIDMSLLDGLSLSNSIQSENRTIKIIFWGRKDLFIKGLDLLIRAFSQIKNENIELHIQGTDIGDTEKLKELISSLQGSNIYLKEKFIGNPLEVLQKYDFMIMPSRLEAFSMAVIEGMLAKLPIVISEEVGAAEYVSLANAGIICKPNVDSIQQAIEEMLSLKDKWNFMGENGKEYLIKNLTWETIGKNVLTTYEDLIK